MNNKFINYNGETLLNTKNKKTKVESQIEQLKQQKQEIINELSSWETKQKKADKLLNYLEEVERFSTKFLAEAIEAEKAKENRDDWWLEYRLEDKIAFALKFKPAKEAFANLICQKIANQVSCLKSQLRDIQSQLRHQQRLFTRIEIRRQGRVLLECKLNNSIGCLGVYQCANCQTNYSVNSQAVEITK